jgi:serine/threonine protein kinase/ABC-type branched-subunit amino acid transport system substrate-binding protein
MKCPNCHADTPAGETFCSNCGAYLAPTVAHVPIAVGAGATPAAGSSSGTSGLLTPGTRLQNGRYVIEQVLGQGGMGAALLAKDTRIYDKLVVIKELITESIDPAERQEDIRNFEQEVKTLVDLDHPSVPKVTDHFQEGSHYFMVQDYVAGENLEERMGRISQPMPEREVLTYASQVLDILAYLEGHRPPIIHRDIKPANIIIGAKDQRAHLVDFGIARADVARNARRKQTTALGTTGYAPPEQYQGNADTRSDLYALAATMHHLLTNRDPRNEPPFAYPPARSLNPRLSPDIERVLNRALALDPNQRYQTAAAMKRMVDAILVQRFQVPSDTSSYLLGTPGPGAAQPPQPWRGQPSSPPIYRGGPVQPLGGVLPSPPSGMYPAPPPLRQKQGGRSWIAASILLLLVVILIAAALFVGPSLFPQYPAGTGGTTPTAPPTRNPISVTQVHGEPIGISDGSFVFDTNREDGTLKAQAAERLRQGDKAAAVSLWNAAVAQDTNDAEALIYLEDQRVANLPHITLVVATALSGDSDTVGVGRDDLQGAYIAQKEFNDGARLPGGIQVRLLIASAGSQATYATQVAQQIVQLAQVDKTFEGVMGWPYSTYSYNAIQVLTSAHIPLVSQTASSDSLTGISPYFFRVAPTNQSQGIAGAKYAEQMLHARNVALFVDNTDLYSQSLAQDFSQQFTADGGTIVARETYTIGKPETLAGTLQDAVSHQPDLIYFSGYASDVGVLLTNLLSSATPASLQVLGGDALYDLGGYPGSARPALDRLHFTTFFYPDEWAVQGLDSSPKKPAFFVEYPAAFDPHRQHQGSPYGYTRPTNDAALSYDALLVLLKAYTLVVIAGKTTVTPQDIQQGLAQIHGTNAVQGVSGQISFDVTGNAVAKAVVILYFDSEARIHMEPEVQGTFLIG